MPLETLRTRLLSHLGGRTGLVETLVEFGDGAGFRISHPAEADALIEEEEFARDERLPYWAELWPSAVALAGCVYEERLAKRLVGRSAIELGCGVGLPSVAALARGLEVTATDHYRAALDFASYNARRNLRGNLELKTRLLDWHAPKDTEGIGLFELVLAADVLYEPRNVPALAALVPTLLAAGGEILLADPRRKDAPAFLEKMREKGFRSSSAEYGVPSNGRRVAVLMHRLRR